MSKAKVHLRIIGDVHGVITHRYRGRCWKNLIEKAQYSVQLGDFGFDYGPLESVDADRHRILAGNHDNYEQVPEFPHFLGDFGSHSFPLKEGEFKFFFVRGGFSIDRASRIMYRSWWPEEELNFVQTREAIEKYEAEKPEIVLSHECPAEIQQFVLTNDWKIEPSHTSRMLQTMYEIHRPKLWIFGHHHRNWWQLYTGQGVDHRGKQVDNGARSPTTFVCLDELGYLDFDETGKPGYPQ